MKKMSQKAEAVINELIANKEPMKTSELTARTGYSRRDIMFAVQELRLAGVRVCSGDPGYWLWNGEDDSLSRTRHQLQSRIINMYRVYRALGDPLPGQVDLFEEMDAAINE